MTLFCRSRTSAGGGGDQKTKGTPSAKTSTSTYLSSYMPVLQGTKCITRAIRRAEARSDGYPERRTPISKIFITT